MDCEKTRNIFKLNQLPSEILECVFHYLPRTSLKECQKVNKAWYALSSPLIWEKIEIYYEKQASSILSILSNENNSRLTKYVKSLRIEHYRRNIEIDLIKQLLLLFPRIEKVYMPHINSESISKINNQEYLLKLVQNCSNIIFFQLGGYDYFYNTNIPVRKDVNDILYALRHTLLKITIEGEKNSKDDWDLSEILVLSPQLEELNLKYIKSSYGVKWWLPIFKVLPQLKSLYIRVNDRRDPCLIDQDVKTYFDKNALQKLFGVVEKLNIDVYDNMDPSWFNSALIRFITQYFVGLKEIFIDYPTSSLELSVEEDLWALQEFLNFTCSRERYQIHTDVCINDDDETVYFNDVDLINRFVHTNFNHALLKSRKNVLNHLIITLYCDNDINDPNWGRFQPFVTFDITLKSQRINNHQILRTTEYYVSFEQYSNPVRDSLGLILPNLNENDALTIKIESSAKAFPFANFHLIGQVLPMVTGSVKKVTLEILSDMKWSQHFMKYKKIQNYHQFTHLEILVNIIDDQTADQLGFSQLSIIFPNVKNLALQYYNGIWDKEKQGFLMNLPRLSLDHFTLDISLIKYKARQLMQDNNDFCGTSFILYIETRMNEYYYQISFEDLSIKKLREEYIKETCEPKMITAHIILNDIKYLELYLFNGVPNNFRWADYSECRKAVNCFYPRKVFENKINFI